ncbi:MAG: 50S ribosomal protein L10 [Chthonomonadales bacterium]|nr:50S ribosomal protein L10 [Chthonomonadales bacterium]
MLRKGPRADKVETVAAMQATLDRAACIIFTNYRGLTVSEITELRRALRSTSGEFHVVKNTLFRRALGDGAPEALLSLLSGPTAVAIALDDPVATSKTLLTFLRDLRKPDVAVKGGWLDGRVFSADDVTALSKAPPKQVLQGQVLGTLQAPLSNFVGTLQGAASEFVRTLQALADQRQAQAA